MSKEVKRARLTLHARHLAVCDVLAEVLFAILGGGRDGLLAQTFEGDFEIVVVDGAGGGGSGRVLCLCALDAFLLFACENA